MRLGKIFIPNNPNKIFLQEIAEWINTNMVTFEKIVTKEGIILIGKSTLFREMTEEEKLIPVYEIHSVASAVAEKNSPFLKFVEQGKSEDGKPH